ncbi:MAG: hypothetical protein EOP47_05115 [Sphingobacteriaceae bacterium]|nr:MAG: hypothetical protein EOP47_05115 [Sphingobacteriaceae bacterium]
MLNRNHIAIGFIAALFFPAIAWVIDLVVLKYIPNVKQSIPYLAAIAANLFLIRYLYKNGQDQAGIGAIICTFIIMALVFLLKVNAA